MAVHPEWWFDMITMPEAATPRSLADGTARGREERLDASRLVAAMLAGVTLTTLGAAAYVYGGTALLVAAIAAGVLGSMGWIATMGRRPAGVPAAFEPYIATVVALLLLYAAQWHRGVPLRGAYPAGIGITGHAFVAAFPLAGSALLVLGALAYYHGAECGRFAAWLTFAWGTVAALAVYIHPVLPHPAIADLASRLAAPLPLATSLFGVRALVREGAAAPHPTPGVTP